MRNSLSAEKIFEPVKKYLPENSFQKVLVYFQKYPIELKITQPRKTRLGTYIKRANGQHVITINNNLNPYSFLITLLHEIAHLEVREKYGRVQFSHGAEWKSEFKCILEKFIGFQIFPLEIEQALLKSLDNIKASQCSDVELYKTLSIYDKHDPEKVMMFKIPVGGLFQVDDGKILKHIKVLRTRSKCVEVNKCLKNNGYYAVPHTLLVKPIYLVEN